MVNEDNTTIKDIIDELEAKQKDGYLFRGEPKVYDKVTSSLYRVTTPLAHDHISIIEHRIVSSCLSHCYDVDTIEAWKSDNTLHCHALRKLSEIQHLGGVTNLIDFTECFHNALFFACDKWPECDGRIIAIHPDKVPAFNFAEPKNEHDLIPWGDHDYIRRTNGYPAERVEAQKSVFIHARNGVLDLDYDVICVPSRLKTDIRERFSADLNINRRSIYPDTIGFVDNNRQTRSLEFMFAAEEHFHNANYEGVIENCGKSTNEEAHSYVYHIWGLAHLQRGETQEAIDKLERALSIDNWRYYASVKNDARGRGNDGNGAWIATQTAKNIAEGKRGEYPTPDAIFALNNILGKGMPFPSSGGMMTSPDVFSPFAPYTVAYQFRRWHVLNVFYDYNTLWDALPQLPEDERWVTQASRLEQEALFANGTLVETDLAGEIVERNHDSNPDYYLDPEFYNPEFYRKLRIHEIENPLKQFNVEKTESGELILEESVPESVKQDD